MDVETCGSWVEQYKIFFDLADATNGRFKYTLDVNALLRVHHLIVTLF